MTEYKINDHVSANADGSVKPAKNTAVDYEQNKQKQAEAADARSSNVLDTEKKAVEVNSEERKESGFRETVVK